MARRLVTQSRSGAKENGATTRQMSRRRRGGDLGAANDMTPLPRSLDIAEVEATVDVERHFASVMAHLKDVPRVSHVADEAAKRRWHDITHSRDADGAVTMSEEERADGVRSFFDQDSLDIRGGEATRARLAVSRQERSSPDVLQLTGGSARRDGLGLTERSNDAPADQTLEDDAGGDVASRAGEFGDAPVQLTDMLRERLMELKADKLKEERSDTFMPRRLNLDSDAALRQRQERPPDRQTPTTLADLCPTDEADTTGGEQDGTHAARRVLQGAASYMPGGHLPPASARHTGAALQPLDAASEAGDSAQALAETMRRPRAARADGAAGFGIGDEGVYLLRLLPRACLCSRREAVALVASGQLRVNNVVERNPFRLVRAEDDVHVAGQPSRLRFAPPRLWIYHKPSYVIASRNDPAGRSLITRHARLLGLDHLIPIGPLPMRAHGVMLLTNDGELAQFLQSPATMMQRTYLLRVRPAIDPVLAHRLNTEGININGQQYRDAEFLVNPATKSRFSLKVKVRGEAMQVAHLLQHLGRTVERGGRISFGPFALSGLAMGSVREVTVPPFYAAHAGAAWRPFIERDWPFFRRQRVARLRRLSRFRELTPKEVEELDSFSYDELRDALSFESSELASVAAERNARLACRPAVAAAGALARDFVPTDERGGGAADISTLSFAPDEPIFEDITAVA